MDDNILNLDNQLCFKIYSASKMLIRLYKPILDKLKLTYPQYVVMLALWEKDNILFKELGKKVMLQTGTLTPIVQKLEKMGNIQRIRDTEDERNVLISLTEKGKELKNEAQNIPKEILEKVGISHEQYRDFLLKTETLFNILNKAEDRY